MLAAFTSAIVVEFHVISCPCNTNLDGVLEVLHTINSVNSPVSHGHLVHGVPNYKRILAGSVCCMVKDSIDQQ